MGRRRALAALAGMATAGLVVGGWELTRPGAAAAAVNPDAAADAAARRRISALPAGTKVWSFETNATVSSVVVADGILYAGTQDRAVYALDALTGRLRWRHLMNTGRTQFLGAASGAVIAANGYNGIEPSGYNGGVYALDSGTGKLRWNVLDPFTAGLTVSGDVAYVATAIKDGTTGGVTALSTGTGELLWTFDFPASVDVNGGVAVAGGVVYTGTTHGEVFALKASTGEPVWQLADPGVKFSASVQVAHGVLYAASSQGTQRNSNPAFYGFEASTGHQLWQHSLGAGGVSFCVTDEAGVGFACLIHEEKSTRPGASELFAVNAANGQQLWQVPAVGSVYAMTSSPGNNVVYTGNYNGTLDAWQADTGNHQWSYRAGGAVNSDILLQGGVAYFGCADKRVYAVAARS
jgi:outer membrane protein assembly factor BamB